MAHAWKTSFSMSLKVRPTWAERMSEYGQERCYWLLREIHHHFLNENSKLLEYRIFKTWNEILIYYCDNFLDYKMQNKLHVRNCE